MAAIINYTAFSDTELMVQLGAGDDSSLGELINRYQRPLTGYIARVINDSERARDLSQETFIRIFRHAPGYRTTSRFATWLYHIARNIARDELRARRRRPVFTSDDAIRLESVNPQQCARSELREQVELTLAKLSHRDRRLVCLRDVKGHSYEEISTMTGMTLGTVKSGLSRARARFRHHFESFESAA